MKYQLGKFKFGIVVMNFGYAIGVRVNNRAWRIKLPIPLQWATIRYSIWQQGLLKSIRHRFWVC